MNSNQKRYLSAWAAFFCVFSFGLPLGRAEGGADYSIEVSQKFGRGLLNVISSPLEIPCGIRDDVAERGGAGAATGFFKGIAFFARRVLVGVCEVGTFVIPMEATLPPVCAAKPKPQVEKTT